MASERFRLKFMFWLDVRKSDEYSLSEQIDNLKQERSFVKTIRDGIRLVVDLRAGRLDVLAELFPWVQAELSKPQQSLAVISLQTQLERLEYLMEQGIRPTIDTGTIQTNSPLAGPKPLPAPSLSLPQYDDDDEATIILTKSTTQNAVLNFINTTKALQQ